MRHRVGFNIALGCVAIASALVVGGCSDGIFPSDSDHALRSGDGHSGGGHSGGHDHDGGVAGCEDDGTGGTAGSAGSGGSAGSAGNGGSAGSAGSGGSAGSDRESMADAAPVFLTSLLGDPAVALGRSMAWFPGNEGANSGTVPGNVDLPVIDTALDLGDFVLLTSRTEATSAIDCNARSGLLGDNLSFDPSADPSEPLTLDLVSIGGGVIPQGLLNVLHLELGAFAAETSFVDGELQNRYRVADLDLVIGSPLVGEVSEDLHEAIGAIDTQIEQLVNQTLSGGLLQLISVLGVPAPTITVDSNLKDEVFADILTQSLTSANDAVTIDLSTGTITAHLDQLVQGGLNNQPPNTEIIDANTYELLTDPVGDVLQDAMNVALGSIEGSLDAVTITVRWAGPVGLGDQLDVSWTFSLEQAVNGTLPPPTNNSSGLVAQTLATALITVIDAVRIVDGPLGALLQPVYDQIIDNAGNQLFELLVEDIVGDVGGSIMDLLQPVFGLAAQIVSVQVNHQTTEMCTTGMGDEIPEQNTISALSIAVLPEADVARLDLGWAACEVTQPQCN